MIFGRSKIKQLQTLLAIKNQDIQNLRNKLEDAKQKNDELIDAKIQDYLSDKITGSINLFRDKNKKWRFNVKALNHKIVVSSESFNKKQNAEDSVKSLQKIMNNPEVRYED